MNDTESNLIKVVYDKIEFYGQKFSSACALPSMRVLNARPVWFLDKRSIFFNFLFASPSNMGFALKKRIRISLSIEANFYL